MRDQIKIKLLFIRMNVLIVYSLHENEKIIFHFILYLFAVFVSNEYQLWWMTIKLIFNQINSYYSFDVFCALIWISMPLITPKALDITEYQIWWSVLALPECYVRYYIMHISCDAQQKHILMSKAVVPVLTRTQIVTITEPCFNNRIDFHWHILKLSKVWQTFKMK